MKVSAGDVILLYTGRWKRCAALDAWPNTAGFAVITPMSRRSSKDRGVSSIGCDGPNDVSPSGFPPTVTNPLYRLALVAMGLSISENLDFERAAEHAPAAESLRFMAAPLRIDQGTGSPLNPLAIF